MPWTMVYIYIYKLCANKLYNLDEIDKFLERHKLPKLIKKKDNLNRPIASEEVKVVIKEHPQKKEDSNNWNQK